MREDKGLPPAARRSWPLYNTGRTQSRLCSQPGVGTEHKSINLTMIRNKITRSQWRYYSAIPFPTVAEPNLENGRMLSLIFLLKLCNATIIFFFVIQPSVLTHNSSFCLRTKNKQDHLSYPKCLWAFKQSPALNTQWIKNDDDNIEEIKKGYIR